MKRAALIVALLALLIAPVVVPARAQSGYDWCTVMNFTNTLQPSFNLIEGSQFGGFTSTILESTHELGEDTSRLIYNFREEFFVSPQVVSIDFRIRNNTVAPEALLTAAIDAFGIENSFFELPVAVTPGTTAAFQLNLRAESAGIESSIFNFAMQATPGGSGMIFWQDQIRVYGYGVSPWEGIIGSDSCDPVDPEATSTPLVSPTPSPTLPPTNTPPPTLTPSLTLTPTETFTPTETLTPSLTPTPGSCYDPIDSETPGYQYLFITFDCPSPLPYALTSGSVQANAPYSSPNAVYQIQAVNNNGSFKQAQVAIVVEVPSAWHIRAWGAQAKYVLSGSNSGVEVYTRYRSASTGGWSTLQGQGDPGNGTYINRWAAPGGFITDVDRLEVNVQANSNGTAQAWLDNFFVDFDGTYSTPTPTATSTNTGAPTNTGTPTNTRTPHPNPSATIPPPTFPPLASLTPIPTQTRLPVLPTLTGTQFATQTPLPTYTLYPSQTISPSQTLTPTIAGTVATYTATPEGLGLGDGVPVAWGTAPPGDGGVGDLVGTGNSLVNLIVNIYRQGRGYLLTFATTISGIYTSWDTAVPIALPAMPQCATDRLASELCAIYYGLEWTILSGPIGSLIMPFATLAMFLAIVFAAIKQFRAILERLAKVTEST